MTKNIMRMHKVFIVLALLIAMFTGASNEAKRELLAEKRAKSLTLLSLHQLGEVKANG